MAGKKLNAVDVHIGSRIRMRRMMLGMSQEKLGDALGLTFQQVQKYEKGTNGVRGSRMVAIASALKAPVSFFFEGAPGHDSLPTEVIDDVTQGFLASRGGLALAGAFMRIEHGEGRSALINMANALADAQAAQVSTKRKAA